MASNVDLSTILFMHILRGGLVSYSDYFSLSRKMSGKLPTLFWFRYFEITVTSRQLDSEFKNVLVNNKLRDSLLMLLSIDIIA